MFTLPQLHCVRMGKMNAILCCAIELLNVSSGSCPPISGQTSLVALSATDTRLCAARLYEGTRCFTDYKCHL